MKFLFVGFCIFVGSFVAGIFIGSYFSLEERYDELRKEPKRQHSPHQEESLSDKKK